MRAARKSFRRTVAISFALLNLAGLAGIGIVLYVSITRTTTRIIEANLQQTTDMIFQFVETVADSTVRSYLRGSAQMAYDIVSACWQRYRAGDMSESQARELAFRELSQLHIGQTGYAYVLDTSGFMVYHPSPGLNRKPAPEINSPLAAQLSMREGYLEYSWRNPEESTAQPKAMQMAYFAPWKWIITVTSYRSEFDSLVDPDVLQKYVLSIHFGRGGYAFIARQDGTVVVHPRLRGNPLTETGDPELTKLFTAMRTRSEGSVYYAWTGPTDVHRTPKVAWFRQLPRFGWVVATTIPLDDLYAPAYQVGIIILICLGSVLVAMTLAGYGLAARMTRPIELLAGKLDARGDAGLGLRLPIVSQDEIGMFAGHFNEFMESIEASQARLTASMKERARAQAASARLGAAVAQLDEIVMITDQFGRIVYVNPAFEKRTGYTAVEVVGQKPRILRSGKQDERFYEDLDDTLRAGRVWRGRVVNRRRDGTEYIQEGTITPLRDENGAIMSHIEVSRDITDEVEREKHQRQSQKLEAVGTLAGGIAHDFNNILTAILGFAELSLAELDESHTVRPYLAEITSSATRARNLVAKILTFSRQSHREVQSLSLEAVVRDALALLRASLPSTITLTEEIQETGRAVLADATEINQVVMNLCTNSAQAIGEKPGTIRIRVGPANGRAGATDRVELSVTDDGDGMDERTLARIFEPFFTTKKAGRGTGLGLAVVHGIVSEMGGEIGVESAPGAGTTVRIHFPLQGSAPAPQETLVENPPRGRGESVLLVDDEESICSAGKKILEKLGYKVTTVDRPLEALEIVRKDTAAFQLILTDYTMPGMTGIELSRAISRVAPSVPIIMMTGSRDKDIESNAREAGVRHILLKPFRPVEIAQALRSVLDAAPSSAG